MNENDWISEILILQKPPVRILDDLAVRHINEFQYPEHHLHPCPCGIIHEIESQTWYHKAIHLDEGKEMLKVCRACKTCGEILVREMKDERK